VALAAGAAGGAVLPGNKKMKQRFENMTPEEREKFKAEWKNRCGGRWGNFERKDSETKAVD
jgi:Ca2+/H+ antiporter, TMEM165/GDT1 family